MVKIKIFIENIGIQYWLDMQTLYDVNKLETKYKKHPINITPFNYNYDSYDCMKV